MDKYLYLMRKEINLSELERLYSFKDKDFNENWIYDEKVWSVEKKGITGKNYENLSSMAVLNQNFTGNILMSFDAELMDGCTHGIGVLWKLKYNQEKRKRDDAYLAVMQGWWENKLGVEKSPLYNFKSLVHCHKFEQGKKYRILAGDIDGHIFIFVDNKLMLETFDPTPIDSKDYKIGFEAYCSQVRYSNLEVYNIKYNKREMKY